MATYGTKPLDDQEYPSPIVISERVKAFRVGTTYSVRTPYHPEVRKLMAGHAKGYGPDGWNFSWGQIDLMRDLMRKAENILAAERP